MRPRLRLLFGPLAAIALALGVGLLPRMLPGYDSITQTVSEIGEVGSPARVPFTLLVCAVAAFIVVFSSGLRSVSIIERRSALASYLTGLMAVSAAGVGIFAFPHPLHNWFGMSELVGYQAPLALALSWRHDARTRRLVGFSWIMGVLVWCAIAANLVTLDRGGALWHRVAPVYGLVQRSLFAAWFIWLAGAGVLLRKMLSPRRLALGADPM